MKTTLIDANVWLALSTEKHVHFSAANEWFSAAKAGQACFCRVTQMTFLRLLSNRTILDSDLNARDAWNIYQQFLGDDRVSFAYEPLDLEDKWIGLMQHRSNGASWTDAYLAAFAIESKMQFLTLDRSFRHFPGLDYLILGQ